MNTHTRIYIFNRVTTVKAENLQKSTEMHNTYSGVNGYRNTHQRGLIRQLVQDKLAALWFSYLMNGVFHMIYMRKWNYYGIETLRKLNHISSIMRNNHEYLVFSALSAKEIKKERNKHTAKEDGYKGKLITRSYYL